VERRGLFHSIVRAACLPLVDGSDQPHEHTAHHGSFSHAAQTLNGLEGTRAHQDAQVAIRLVGGGEREAQLTSKIWIRSEVRGFSDVRRYGGSRANELAAQAGSPCCVDRS
jgi:hypothetical protein